MDGLTFPCVLIRDNAVIKWCGASERSWKNVIDYQTSCDLGQVCLQAVLGLCDFRDTVGKGHVDAVELIPHFIGSRAKQELDVVSELVGGRPLTLGPQDVVIREF